MVAIKPGPRLRVGIMTNSGMGRRTPFWILGRYRVDLFGGNTKNGVIRMISPPDAHTGVQISRQLTIFPGSSRVRLDLSFTNVKEAPIRWSIWDVTQLRAEKLQKEGSWIHDPSCVVTAPLNPQSRFLRGFNVMFGEEDNPQWQIDKEQGLFVAPYLWEIGKVGLDSPAGWVAFHQGTEKVAFIEQFTFEPDEEYPDEGVTVECWTVGAGKVGNLNYTGSNINLMETEVLSPLKQIAPGSTASFTIEWGACRCDGPIIDVQAGGVTVQKLTSAVTDNNIYLTGQFGVFDAGELILQWRDVNAVVIYTQPLDQVNPLTAVTLNHQIQLPDGAFSVECVIRADADGMLRPLAQTRVN